MAGLKISFFVCLAIASMINAAPSDSSEEEAPADPSKNWPRISEQWLYKHGCPKEGPFKADCNYCRCPKARSKITPCTLMLCYTPVIEGWSQGLVRTCTPGVKFFSGCSLCTCDESGKDAVCDDSACQYYEDVVEDEVTTISSEDTTQILV